MGKSFADRIRALIDLEYLGTPKEHRDLIAEKSGFVDIGKEADDEVELLIGKLYAQDNDNAIAARRADQLIKAQAELIDWHMERLGLAILPAEIEEHASLVQAVVDAGGGV